MKQIWWLSLLGIACAGLTPVDDYDADTDTDTDTDSLGPLAVVIETEPTEPIEQGKSVLLSGRLSGWTEDTRVRWVSDTQGLLMEPLPDGDGRVTLDTSALLAGWHGLSLEAQRGDEVAEYHTSVGICTYPAVEDFSSPPDAAQWTVYGDAQWDSGGWLEITGNDQYRSGQIFKTDKKIQPGNFVVSFDIATGGGMNGGADGFALSVWDVADPVELDALMGKTQDGGGLGYGLTGGGAVSTHQGFHIEFDTYENGDDPTTENHIGIMLNGDQSNHYLWAAVPSLEDLNWRRIRVEIESSTVTVDLDGVNIMRGDISGFLFEGGYIGVSGSTGASSNYHRFDNLWLKRCEVP